MTPTSIAAATAAITAGAASGSAVRMTGVAAISGK